MKATSTLSLQVRDIFESKPYLEGLILIFLVIFCATQSYAQTTLPFSETWESGQFTTHGWAVNQGSGQCLIVDEGIGGGKAVKTGHLATQTGNDSVVLQTPLLDATNVAEGILLFRFGYKLMNPDSTRWPLLKVYCDAGAGWEKLYELTYNASYDWRELKTHLAMAVGHQFRLMWVACREADSVNGQWLIDNISISGPSDKPFFPLTAVAENSVSQYQTKLNWEKPQVNGTTGALSHDTIAYYEEFIEMDLFFQELKHGYGVRFNYTPFHDANLYELRFHHHSWLGFTGRSSYNIRIMDLYSGEIVKTSGPFTTTCTEGWEEHIPLDLSQFNDIDSIAVLIEPLTYNPEICMPGVSLNDFPVGDKIHTIRISLLDPSLYSGIEYAEIAVMVTFLTPEGKQFTIDPSSYNIQRWQQSLPLNYNLMATTDSTTTEWFDADVTKGWYSYYVAANYADGSAIHSDTVAVEMPSGIGIQEAATTRPAVFPNPVTGNTIRFSYADQIALASVYDLTGRCLLQTAAQDALQAGIDVSHLTNGHFIVKLLLQDGNIVCRKVSVVR
ncbi:MAG TPA: hypothetical protein DEO70_05705 [Bacteroidales bacterium]|nr:MAG: hypothetical protein A2X11_10860 [Bacteroidetes bacterium GWE2_42_24]OFY32047.1 MAG: hypothetical protein A2X09_10425 [Bacteroidetes bacterium GWF2_43_11]HBZ66315.1 hypothetical protein [Bacteroidales bacterium]